MVLKRGQAVLISLQNMDTSIEVVHGFRGISSAGRAPALQAGGQRFDPVMLHQHLPWCLERNYFREYDYQIIKQSKTTV